MVEVTIPEHAFEFPLIKLAKKLKELAPYQPRYWAPSGFPLIKLAKKLKVFKTPFTSDLIASFH